MIDEEASITPEAIAEPYLIVKNEGEYLLVGNGILVPYDDKLLIILD